MNELKKNAEKEIKKAELIMMKEIEKMNEVNII